MTGQVRTSRDRQREETRRRIFDAALEVFREVGVAGAKIDEITSRAGVSRPTFYFHYPTKDDVLAQLLYESEETLVQKTLELPPETPIDGVLRFVAQTIAEHWRDDPRLLAEVGTIALRISSNGVDELKNAHPIREVLVARFELAVERQEISQLIPPPLMADFFLVNQFGAALAWCGNPDLMTLEGMLSNVALFFLRAARAD